MLKKSKITVFLIVIFLTFLIILLSNFGITNGITSFFSRILFPIQKSFYQSFGLLFNNQENLKLTEENLDFLKIKTDLEKLEKDNYALRDQFSVQKPEAQNLLPAKVIGFPSFIPNVSYPENLILDKGLDDGLKVGNAVLYKDNLVGKITRIDSSKSIVSLITNPNMTLAVKTGSKNAIGLVKGLGGGEMILGNVLLSEPLKNSDIVFTKGDLNIDGVGFPPDLIVGKIISIDKNPSALFQNAEVKSMLDFTKLNIVFVYKGSR